MMEFVVAHTDPIVPTAIAIARRCFTFIRNSDISYIYMPDVYSASIPIKSVSRRYYQIA